MERPHASDDVRERALAAIDEGRSVADVAATPCHAFDELWSGQHATWHHQWSRRTAEGTWMEPYGWQDADAINATTWGWELVTTRADVMARFPAYNAIVMCLGRFYLAVLEGGGS